MDNFPGSNLPHITHIPFWDSPWKYLGGPAEWGGSKVSGLSWFKPSFRVGKVIFLTKRVKKCSSNRWGSKPSNLFLLLLLQVLQGSGGVPQAKIGVFIGRRWVALGLGILTK